MPRLGRHGGIAPALLGRHLADPQRAVLDLALDLLQLHASALGRAICLSEHNSRLARLRAFAGAQGDDHGWQPSRPRASSSARKRAIADVGSSRRVKAARCATAPTDDPLMAPGQLGALGIGDRPAEPLDELRGGVIVAHTLGADFLVEQDPMLVAPAHVWGDDDALLSSSGNLPDDATWTRSSSKAPEARPRFR